jgi:hypothetical protein
MLTEQQIKDKMALYQRFLDAKKLLYHIKVQNSSHFVIDIIGEKPLDLTDQDLPFFLENPFYLMNVENYSLTLTNFKNCLEEFYKHFTGPKHFLNYIIPKQSKNCSLNFSQFNKEVPIPIHKVQNLSIKVDTNFLVLDTKEKDQTIDELSVNTILAQTSTLPDKIKTFKLNNANNSQLPLRIYFNSIDNIHLYNASIAYLESNNMVRINELIMQKCTLNTDFKHNLPPIIHLTELNNEYNFQVRINDINVFYITDSLKTDLSFLKNENVLFSQPILKQPIHSKLCQIDIVLNHTDALNDIIKPPYSLLTTSLVKILAPTNVKKETIENNFIPELVQKLSFIKFDKLEYCDLNWIKKKSVFNPEHFKVKILN